MEEYPMKIPLAKGWRKTKRPPLTTSEIIKIIHEVLVEHEF